jgi:hypothetical protein
MKDPIPSYVAAYLATVAVIHLYPQGPWRNWTHDTDVAIDPWTWTHVGWGVVAERMNVPFGTYMILATLNEVAEALARRYTPQLTWGGHESPANVAMDLVANAAGYAIPRAILGKSK